MWASLYSAPRTCAAGTSGAGLCETPKSAGPKTAFSGSGEWGVGNGCNEAISYSKFSTPHSPFPTPHSEHVTQRELHHAPRTGLAHGLLRIEVTPEVRSGLAGIRVLGSAQREDLAERLRISQVEDFPAELQVV